MKKKKVNFLINIVIILIVLGIVLFFSLKDDYETILQAILNMHKGWIFLAILVFCLYRIMVSISHYNIVKLNGEKISLLRSIQINFIILFFHGVTPFAGGGQPMEIYYLHNEKISITKATNITLQNFIVYQIALVLVGMFALIYNYFVGIFPANSLIKRLVIVGFTINMLVLIVTYVLSFGKKINRFICNKGVNLIGKFGIIKDIDLLRDKLNEYLNNFHKNAVKLKKSGFKVSLLIGFNMLSLFLLYMVPYIVLRGLGIHDLSLLVVVVSTAYVMTIGSFVPIPGGTGGIEYGYIFFFGHLIKGSILNASMLVWRFITYYLGMILGALALSVYRKKDKKCE